MILGHVSDLFGRERAIRIVREVIESDDYICLDGQPDPDGLAVQVVLALDHAERFPRDPC